MVNTETINKQAVTPDSHSDRSFPNWLLKPFAFCYRHLFTASVIALLIYGWQNRDDNYITAETGAGYALGIIGCSLMLVLLLYPLSKRVRLLTRWIPMRYWFGIHMLLGVIGPLMILYHSNFHLGSTNSSIALICMLVVAGSGVIGRYFYTHIHHGLYGTRITYTELKKETETDAEALVKLYSGDAQLETEINKLEAMALQPYTGLFSSLIQAAAIKRHARRIVSATRKRLSAQPAATDAVYRLRHHLKALQRAAAFRVYERLFSLWHILHLPLFFMMVITAIIHIFAVHMY